MTITWEERLARLKENCKEVEYAIIGIYKDQSAYKCYERYMSPYSKKRHSIYPVSEEKIVGKIGSSITGSISAIFFGTKFLDDEKFIEEQVLKCLNNLKFNPKEIKVVYYKIVN